MKTPNQQPAERTESDPVETPAPSGPDFPGRTGAEAEVAGLAVVLARSLLRIFFRQIEVVGAERLPSTGPVMLVANHVNSLVDPAMLLSGLGRRPRLLAKSTLWRHPVVRPLLELGAAIPVFRRRDPGVDPTKNQQTFARCHEVLAAGGMIAIFPEGTSHNQPSLVPLKTGVSRIVLEAEERFGGLGVRVVPVGLTFDAKTRFRSRALMQVGEPLEVGADVERYRDDPRGAVTTLTERVHEALEDVTLNFPSWDEARLIGRAAEIWEQPAPELPGEPSMLDAVEVRRAFVEGYRSLQRRHPAEVASLSAEVAAYDEALSEQGLEDEQVAASYPLGGVVRFVVESLALLLLRLPLALVGTAFSIVPYYVASWVAHRWGESDDLLATYKLLASLFFYPAAWVLIATTVGWATEPILGLAALGLAPLASWVALRFHERRGYFLRHVRAFLVLRSRSRRITALRRQRGELLSRIRELAERFLTRRAESSA